ncbi:MAG TPA: GlsB/YeaQ/YmgE family stress response membrane protein [Novosphingobium sp.]
MTLVFILAIGGMIGWIASIVMRTDARRSIFLDVAAGIAGASVAGVLLTPLLGGAPIASGVFDPLSLVASLLGAVLLLGVINLLRQDSPR